MKKIFLIACAIFAIASLNAKPAYRGGIEVTQPDGSKITVYQHGDEFFHYTTLGDGTWVERQLDGFYKQVPALTKEQVRQKRMQSSKLRVTKQVQQAYPLNIAPRGLVILVNFKDVKMDSLNTQEAFDRMLNAEHYTDNGAFGSARQYFINQSGGKYTPQFDVVGPVDLPESMEYYGANDAAGDDLRVDKLVKKACSLADELGVDFAQYDNNNDGVVDFVYFIYAGYGEADSELENTIWPHAFWLYQGYRQRFYVDNKLIDMYACGAELNFSTKKRDGIGTFCHEFGHVLGLPDLYATDGNFQKDWGMWDIMDYGSYNDNGNTPPAYAAHERFFLGWLKPTILNATTTGILLDTLTASHTAYLISATGEHNLVGNDPKATEYYLLENRQQVEWDAYLPGHGMLITKVQYDYQSWLMNAPNTALGHRIDLIEADGLNNLNGHANWYYGKPGDAFPLGANTYMPYDNFVIKNIVEQDGKITFDFEKVITSVSDAPFEKEQILAIYNLLGQLQVTTNLDALESGVYIVKTNKTTKKVSIR